MSLQPLKLKKQHAYLGLSDVPDLSLDDWQFRCLTIDRMS